MKGFAYLTADSFKAASQALAKSPEALPKAAGTDLLGLMKDRILEPPEVVNLLRIKTKAFGEMTPDTPTSGGGVTISPLVTLADLAAHDGIRKDFGALHKAAAEAATPQIRNVGTLGGNLCQLSRCAYLRNPGFDCFKVGARGCAAKKPGAHNRFHAIFPQPFCACAHPSNLAPALIVCGARLVIGEGKGAKSIEVEDLYMQPERGKVTDTVLRQGELITQIQLQKEKVARNSTYLELRERQSFDFAMASVAAGLDVHHNTGKVQKARIALGGVAPVPLRVRAAEKALVGSKLSSATIEAAAKAAVKGAQPLAQNGYKVTIVQTLVRRALEELK